MTASQAVLALGTITLGGCGGGLVLIHGKNPLLKGLNWMGTALVVGGLAAGFLLGSSTVPALGPAANVLILLAFICCYRADQYLIGVEPRRDMGSRALLGCQAVACCLQWMHLIGIRGGLVIVSILAALQLESTAALIRRNARSEARLAARCTVWLMHFLAMANVLRGGCAGAGLLNDPRHAELLNLLTYNLFVSAAIGLAFAFFWRTTTKLSLDLEHMASTDPLTRVFNRRVFLNWCENEQTRALRSGVPFSVLMVDFDHFKRVNDTFGHHVGDQVLCAAVERIQDSIRGIDVLCRWGGEEFTVLLPNASQEATQIVAERIRQNVRGIKSADVRFSGVQFARLDLSASIGGATYLGAADHFEHMLQRADRALYQAKREGRDRVVHASWAASEAVLLGAALV